MIVESRAHILAAIPLLKGALLVAMIIGLAVVIAGCVLVYLGATGHTEMDLFGTKVSTGSVGVVGIVCGTVAAIMITRRMMRTIEKLAALPKE